MREHGHGCVAARHNRITGALRQLYRPGTQCDDPGWFVVCYDHASTLNTDTRSQARSAMADPDWCEECQAIADGRP